MKLVHSLDKYPPHPKPEELVLSRLFFVFCFFKERCAVRTRVLFALLAGKKNVLDFVFSLPVILAQNYF